MLLKTVILLSTVSAVSLQNVDYCNRKLCKGLRNVACNHKQKFDTKCPKDIKLVELTPELQDEFLHHHNLIRDLVASGKHHRGYQKAAKMCTMVKLSNKIFGQKLMVDILGMGRYFIEPCITQCNELFGKTR